MIPRASTNVAVIEGALDNADFSIEMNAEMFKLLSGGVYSDKIGAVIRELACNAHDAHREAGNPNPIQVTLPHEIAPTLIIRDEGTGLSHEDVLSLYTRYGCSTKRNSNDFTGKLGIGSKAPFAYTPSFSVESRFNGERRSYTAVIGPNGKPSISYEGMAATDEPNGLTVMVPVMSSDIETFRSKAQAILQWFDPAPKGIEGVTYLARYAGWTMRDKNQSNSYVSSGSYARMGNVVYRLDASKVRAEYGTPDHEKINEPIGVLGLPLVIDFAIGELEITASRESLSYDNQTVAAIRARLPSITSEILKEYQAQVEAEPTPYLAFKLMRKFYRETPHPVDQLITKNLTYRGQKMDYTSMEITVGDAMSGPSDYPGTTLRAYRHSDRGRRYRHVGVSYPIKFTNSRTVYVNADDDLVVYLVDDTVKNWQRRIEADLGRGSERTLVLLVKGHPAVVTDVLGPYEIKNLADIEPVPVDRSTSYVEREPPPKLYEYVGHDWKRTNDQLSPDDLWVRVFDGVVASDDPACRDFHSYRESHFAVDRTLYGVPRRYKSTPGGTNLAAYVDQARRDYAAAHPDLMRRQWLRQQSNAVPTRLRALLQEHAVLLQKREFRPLAEVIGAVWTTIDIEVAAHLTTLTAYEPRRTDVDVGERVAKIYERWPLLKWLEDVRYPGAEHHAAALAYIGV